MNRQQHLRRWLRTLTIHERKLLGPAARARNAFITSAANQYEAHHSIPKHVGYAHEIRIQNYLAPHYSAVTPVFGNLVAQRFKSRTKRIEIKRLTFLSLMQDWIRQRALAQAATIASTDQEDVQDVIEQGITEGLGTEDIARNIRDLTGQTPYRAATIARTETHAAATFGAIEEARVTSDEIGIVLQKEWLPTLDDRTRSDHAAMADAEPIPLDEKFQVGGSLMDRPGDPSAPPEQVINCRCAISITEQPLN